MGLYVHVAEARSLPLSKAAASGVFAKLKVGKHEKRTRTVTGTPDPIWDEEFVFSLDDGSDDEEDEERTVKFKLSVFRDGGGRGGAELLGLLSILIEGAAEAKSPTWFSLQSRRRGAKSKIKDFGKILLTLSFGRNSNHNVITSSTLSSFSDSVNHGQTTNMLESDATANTDLKCVQDHSGETHGDKNGESFPTRSQRYNHLEISDTHYGIGSPNDANSVEITFEDALETMETRDESHLPEDLHGGILHGKFYTIDPKDLNSLLYKPNSEFRRQLAQRQGTVDYGEGPWRRKCEGYPCFSRIVTYTRAATKLVKAVKATEEQVYLKADGKNFVVLNRVSTPDVPYGNCFQVALLYKITPGPESSSGEQSSCLSVSWCISFHQNTIMKSLIEGTARQGLKDSYESFAEVLLQYIKPLNSSEILLDKEQLLAPLQLDHQSDWRLFMQYFCNLTFYSTILIVLYVFCHILLSEPSKIQGLEFDCLDLPDTFGELITGGVVCLQVIRVLNMISRFVQARLKRGSDHGVKAQGDGWLITIALIEGSKLPSATPGYPDTYVVFNCNGRSRTSSVQLQTEDPQWNEILEFDAMQDPPSVVEVKVFSFNDGAFHQDILLGHAEINFLKHSSAELTDMWISLKGKLVHPSHSKLRLRIFVDNNGGEETIQEYLQKMEKEVGKKVNRPSHHKNSTFQKLFGLPPEEFLIYEFSCCLKRNLPLQGKIYLSARIIGFYSNLFGYKTKFLFLWEDIERIHAVPPSLTTVGSPALLIILRNGRGLDARHGAKALDEEGRLKFQFQSFISFNRANRVIMALWRSKSWAAAGHSKSEEEQPDQVTPYDKNENSDSVLSNEDTDLLKACSLELPIDVSVNVVMKVFDGGFLENKIMAKVGCLNYSVTTWAGTNPQVYERKANYKFDSQMPILDGEVVSTQRKSQSAVGDGWIVDEELTIQNIPLGDHFHARLSYRFENCQEAPAGSKCKCDIFLGVEWIKNTKFRKRITTEVCQKLTKRSREMLELVAKEFL